MDHKFKIKHKLVFIFMCIGWLASMIGIGIFLDNPFWAIVAMCLCSTVAIWQTNLDEGGINKAVLIFFAVNLLLGYAVNLVPLLLAGERTAALHRLLSTLLILVLLAAFPVLFFCRMGRNSRGSDGSESELSAPARDAALTKTFGIARRLSVLSQLLPIVLRQLLLSVCLWFAVMLGVDALEYFLHVSYNAGAFPLTRTAFMPVTLFFLLGFLVVGLWFGVTYARLNFTCAQLGNSPDGMQALSDEAGKSYLRNQAAKAAGIPYAKVGALSKGSRNLAAAYLMAHGKKPVNPRIFPWVSRGLTLLQILLALGLCLYAYL